MHPDPSTVLTFCGLHQLYSAADSLIACVLSLIEACTNVFTFVDENQEGVMDNLLEALKTGSAFNVNREKRDGKRRTPRAAGGWYLYII